MKVSTILLRTSFVIYMSRVYKILCLVFNQTICSTTCVGLSILLSVSPMIMLPSKMFHALDAREPNRPIFYIEIK